MGINGILLSIISNAIRTVAIKKLVDIFIDKNACTWKFYWMAYVFFGDLPAQFIICITFRPLIYYQIS